jgi:hypothetical protein
VGVYYQRKIYKHFGIKIGYGQWNTFPWFKQGFLNHQPFTINVLYDSTPGTILSSFEYKMYEGYIQYGYSLRRWRFRAGLGLSYTTGVNSVVDSVYYNPDPPHDFIVYDKMKNASYWGIIPEVSIDFLCWRKRLSFGADIRYRKYWGFYFAPTEYGFHAAFNF